MRKGLFGVSVTSDALREAKPRRQTIDNWPDDQRARHALAGVAGVQPIPIGEVEARQKMKIQKGSR